MGYILGIVGMIDRICFHAHGCCTVSSFLCHEVKILTFHGDKEKEGADTEDIQTSISFGANSVLSRGHSRW